MFWSRRNRTSMTAHFLCYDSTADVYDGNYFGVKELITEGLYVNGSCVFLKVVCGIVFVIFKRCIREFLNHGFV